MKTSRDSTLDAFRSETIASAPVLGKSGSSRLSNLQIWHPKSLQNPLIAGVILAVSLSTSVSAIQTTAPSPLNASPSPFPDPFHAAMDGPLGREQIQKQYKQLNIQRQKQLTSDSVKLLALATELKAEVETTANADLTDQQVRKAALIEKLARSIRDKMRDADSPAQPMVPMLRK